MNSLVRPEGAGMGEEDSSSFQAIGMKNTSRTQLCRIACRSFRKRDKSFSELLYQTSGIPLDSPSPGRLLSPSIFISYSGKTLSLPTFSLMWNTKSLLALLKAEEITISAPGPKKMTAPFIFPYGLSLAGDCEKAETYLKLLDFSFYTRERSLVQEHSAQVPFGCLGLQTDFALHTRRVVPSLQKHGRRIQAPIFC